MKKTKVIKKIRKTINYLKGVCLLSGTIVSIIYIVIIILVATLKYLNNRPYKLSAFCMAMVVILLVVDRIATINYQKKQAKQKRNKASNNITSK